MWAGVFFGLAEARAQAEQPKASLLFYDPYANHESLVEISKWFNRFLEAAELDLAFRPIKDATAFEKTLKDGSAGFAVVSSLYLAKMKPGHLIPLLVPAVGGNVYHQRLLVDRDSGSSKDLSRKVVAVAAAGKDFQQEIAEIKASLAAVGLKADKVRFLRVSKDIDALLAVAFGQAQAALTTPASLAAIARVNPAAAESFRTVAETKRFLRSPLCRVVRRRDQEQEKKLVEALLRIHETKPGRKTMNALGFDRWVSYAPRMLEDVATLR